MNILLFPALYLWMLLFNLRPIQSLDIWWHLASGRYIAESWSVPRVDPFSLLCQGSPWVDSYWLFELILFGIFRLTGLSGVIISKAIFIPLILFVQDKSLRDRGVHWIWRLAALAGLFFAAHPRGFGWSEQASLITFFFFSLILAHLETFRQNGWTRALRFWPILFMLWANMHRGFVLGGVVAVCYMLGTPWKSGKEGVKRVLWLILCGAATLATPYGIDLYRMIWHDLSLSPVHIAGWSRPPWDHLELFWISVGLMWVVIIAQIIRQKKMLALPQLGTAVFLTWIGTRFVANVPYLMLFVWPFLAATLAGWTETSRMTQLADRYSKAICALVLLLVIGSQAVTPARGGINARVFPTGACDFIQSEKIAGPFYNEYHFGGYWLWRFGGERPVFIDGRYPAVECYQNLQVAIEAAKNGPPGEWEKFLERSGVEAALIGYPRSDVFPSVTEAYFPPARWALVYWDDTAQIFVKRNEENRRVIQHSAFDAIHPDAQESYFLKTWRAAGDSGRKRIVADLMRNAQLHPESRRTRRLLDLARTVTPA